MCAWKMVRQKIIELVVLFQAYLFSLLTIPGRQQVQSEDDWVGGTLIRQRRMLRLPDECSSNHGLSDRWSNKQCEQDQRINMLEEEVRYLKDELMSMKCQVEIFRRRRQEVTKMLRAVRIFLSYFRPHKDASNSVISFFKSEGNTDEELTYFREFFSYFVPSERLSSRV